MLFLGSTIAEEARRRINTVYYIARQGIPAREALFASISFTIIDRK
jgi:hypothetical protein